jgi:hypothetical protein
MLSVVMLSVVMMCVIILSVVAILAAPSAPKKIFATCGRCYKTFYTRNYVAIVKACVVITTLNSFITLITCRIEFRRIEICGSNLQPIDLGPIL